MRSLLILAALAAAAPISATAQPAHTWEIGPVFRGRNASVGMPPAPTPAGWGWYFNFPFPHAGAGHVHYVTFQPGPLLGRSKIVMRYRVDAAPGVKFVPQERPAERATVSLYFQRSGDNWSGKRHYEHFRWFAPLDTLREIVPGEHEVTVSLYDGKWGSVMGHPAAANWAAFQSSLAETDRIGVLFGSAGGRGHGVYATGPARFTLISFRIL